MADCVVVKKNLGLSQCNKLPGQPSSMFTTPKGFKATPEQAIDPEFWQAAMLADSGERIFLWPNFVNSEDVSEEPIYETTSLAMIKVRDGKFRFRFSISQSLCLHKAMYSHRSNGGIRVIIVDNEGQYFGTEDDDGNFMGFDVQLLNTEKLKLSDGSVATKSPIYVGLQDPKEIDARGLLVDAPFHSTLDRLTDVTLTVISSAAALIVVSVKVTCDGTPVSGLIDDDFVLTKTNGDAQAVVSATEEDGVYSLVGVALVDGFVNLKDPADLSITAYESTGPGTVNVP